MECATLHERRGAFILASLSRTSAGMWLANSCVARLEAGQSAGLGPAIRMCLTASREGVPHPRSFTGHFDAMLALAGVGTHAAFMASARCVEIEADGGAVTLIPTRNLGAREGFLPLAHRRVRVAGSDAELGAAALAALGASE